LSPSAEKIMKNGMMKATGGIIRVLNIPSSSHRWPRNSSLARA